MRSKRAYLLKHIISGKSSGFFKFYLQSTAFSVYLSFSLLYSLFLTLYFKFCICFRARFLI